MKLSEAYERLEWGDPVVFERCGMRTAQAHGQAPVSIGTSAHTLIEMYLDMAASMQDRSALRRPLARFLVICEDIQTGRYLRRWLDRIHQTLRADVDPKDVRFFPLKGGNESVIRETTWHSWAVFCDHKVKENESLERIMGPYRLVRSVRRFQDHWIARDRDDRQVCRLTKGGVNELMQSATCPITMLSAAPVTYPAFQAEFLNPHIRLKMAFER